MSTSTDWRRLPIGAELAPHGGVHFRVWAQAHHRVRVRLEKDQSSHELNAETGGYYSALVPSANTGDRYGFLLDDDEKLYPDPASRSQPDGPHGPSAIVDPTTYRWRDDGWRGVERRGHVMYEVHIGTFTPEGTFGAAARELKSLAELGITMVEVMPIAEFPGRFGWGYDGVDLFAPTRLYGTPDDFRHFVDTAHANGLGVILDVVYNHLGPDGNYLAAFAPQYFTDRYRTDWGAAINFDGEQSQSVREFFIANAGYWIDEFHVDALRLDATHSIFDESEVHVLAEIGARVRSAAKGRGTLVIAENDQQNTLLLRSRAEGGAGLDMLWNDDWHHMASVAVTGRAEAYLAPYTGRPQEFVSAAKYGTLHQGQHSSRHHRGHPAIGLEPAQFVNYLQNHDQVANTALGVRMHHIASPGRYRALTAFLLLSPQTPLLFQGQEFGSSAPFHFFADHHADLAGLVHEGRREFFKQFPSFATPPVLDRVPDPAAESTFAACKLDFREREAHHQAYALHRDLLRLRHGDSCLGASEMQVDGAVLSEGAFILRFFGENGDDRLLLVNLGGTLRLPAAPEPLLAPPTGRRWDIIWSSDDTRYGGRGTPRPAGDAVALRLDDAIALFFATRLL